jgi:hypothetical protein
MPIAGGGKSMPTLRGQLLLAAVIVAAKPIADEVNE